MEIKFIDMSLIWETNHGTVRTTVRECMLIDLQRGEKVGIKTQTALNTLCTTLMEGRGTDFAMQECLQIPADFMDDTFYTVFQEVSNDRDFSTNLEYIDNLKSHLRDTITNEGMGEILENRNWGDNASFEIR